MTMRLYDALYKKKKIMYVFIHLLHNVLKIIIGNKELIIYFNRDIVNLCMKSYGHITTLFNILVQNN